MYGRFSKNCHTRDKKLKFDHLLKHPYEKAGMSVKIIIRNKFNDINMLSNILKYYDRLNVWHRLCSKYIQKFYEGGEVSKGIE